MSAGSPGPCAVPTCSCEQFVDAGKTRDTGSHTAAPGSPGAPICTCGHVELVHRRRAASRLRRLVGR